MGQVLAFALLAALNPTLVAAATAMMLLANPRRLMIGYLLGALTTSVTLGLVIVFSLQGSTLVKTTRTTLSPAASMALGAIALITAIVLGTEHHEAAARRRRERRRDRPPPRWQRAVGRGTARTAFVVGACLTLPGGSYLAGLSHIDRLGYPAAATVLAVVAFNVVMLALLEVPLLGFTLAPEPTVRSIDRARSWVGRHSHRLAVRALTLLGAALLLRGLIGLLT